MKKYLLVFLLFLLLFSCNLGEALGITEVTNKFNSFLDNANNSLKRANKVLGFLEKSFNKDSIFTKSLEIDNFFKKNGNIDLLKTKPYSSISYNNIGFQNGKKPFTYIDKDYIFNKSWTLKFDKYILEQKNQIIILHMTELKKIVGMNLEKFPVLKMARLMIQGEEKIINFKNAMLNGGTFEALNMMKELKQERIIIKRKPKLSFSPINHFYLFIDLEVLTNLENVSNKFSTQFEKFSFIVLSSDIKNEDLKKFLGF